MRPALFRFDLGPPPPPEGAPPPGFECEEVGGAGAWGRLGIVVVTTDTAGVDVFVVVRAAAVLVTGVDSTDVTDEDIVEGVALLPS